MKRTKLSQRVLPSYSAAEELTNTLTHGLGAALALLGLALCLFRAYALREQLASWIYGISMLAVYSVSAVYHGVKPGTGKKVLQILDHCMIYTLIAGTYTPITLVSFVPYSPAVGWGLLSFQWICAIVCIVLNAIDLRKYRVISMVAYILMGWSVIFVFPVAFQTISTAGLWLLLLGGISYTLGAILYGIGSKLPWFHSIFHIFVFLGSFLHFLFIYLHIL